MNLRIVPFSKKWILVAAAFLLILGLRIILQIVLYQSGFLSLTADEFGRTLLAARWSNNHLIVWHGEWLPFYLILFGGGLDIVRDMLWTPRIIAAGCGLLALFAMFALTKSLFKNDVIALLGAFLFAVSPAAVWLSSTPLTEMPYTLLILLFTVCLIDYLGDPRPRTLILGAIFLGLATGFRFEGWFVAGIFLLFLMGRIVFQFRKNKIRSLDLLVYAITILITFGLPLAWIVGSYLYSGDFLYFFTQIKSYKLNWYGSSIAYENYIKTLFSLDPYLLILGIATWWWLIKHNSKSAPIMIYTALTLFPLAIFVLLHGGQVEPPGNYLRYLAPFVFVLYPGLAYFIFSILKKLFHQEITKWIVIGFCIVIMGYTQIAATFQYQNDPASAGIQVGETIQKVRSDQPAFADRFVMIELGYWQYLAIHVGANDTSHILYDRQLDTQNRQSISLLQTDVNTFKACIKQYDVALLILRDPSLREIVEKQLMLVPGQAVNGYVFYDISKDQFLRGASQNSSGCPLIPETGN